MTSPYGRGASHEHVADCTQNVRFECSTLLSSIRANGEMVPLVFEGALNGELFKEYTAWCLVPTLKAKDIIVPDNLSSHKVKGVIDHTIAVGVTVRYLPPYSTDLNPIEMMWSKIKNFLRKMKARTGKCLRRGCRRCTQAHYHIRHQGMVR